MTSPATDKRPVILVLHGPNMNMLGVRLPHYYGHATLTDLEQRIVAHAASYGMEADCRQSNSEGQLVTWIQEAYERRVAAIMINPAAFTHSSIAILDALKLCGCPVMEVHFGNLYARNEEWRHLSYVSYVADGVVAGFRQHGYLIAIDALAERFGLARRASAA